LLQTNLQRMSLSISIRAMFFCAGAIIGGFVYKVLNRGALYPIFILTKGLCVALIPLYATYPLFLFFSGVIGLVSGAADTSVNVWILDIWGERSAPFVQALQFFWAVGFIVSPLISNPFLQQDARKVDLKALAAKQFTTPSSFDNVSSASFEAEALVASSTVTAEPIATAINQISSKPESLLYIPYGVAGALCLIGSVSLLFIYVVKRISSCRSFDSVEPAQKKPEAKKTTADLEVEQSAELQQAVAFSEQRSYVWQILLYCCVMTSVFCASEMTTFQYIPTYCVKLSLGLTKSQGSLVMTGVAISFAAGRFIGILCAIRYKPEHILWFDWIIIVAGNVTLLFSNWGLAYLWAGSLLIGFGYASFFAAVFSFLKERIKVDNLTSSIIILSSLSGNAFGFPVLIGRFIDSHPLVMIYGNIVCLIIMFICFIGMFVMDAKYGVRSHIIAKHKQLQLTESSTKSALSSTNQ
jgi:MFS family permease